MAARLRMRDAGGILRTVVRIRMRDAGNIFRTIQRIRMRDAGGVLRTVFQYLTATPSTTNSLTTGSGLASSGTVTSPPVTITVAGGVAAFTYAWSFVSGSAVITITSPTAASTTFSGVIAAGPTEVANYICTVTDSTGAVVNSDVVRIALRWIDTR